MGYSPNIATEVYVGPEGEIYLAFINVGKGPGLDVEIDVFWEVEGGGGTGGLPLVASTFLPQELRWKAAPTSTGRTLPMTLAEMPYVRVLTSAKMMDVHGDAVESHDTIDFIRGAPGQRYSYEPPSIDPETLRNVRRMLGLPPLP